LRDGRARISCGSSDANGALGTVVTIFRGCIGVGFNATSIPLVIGQRRERAGAVTARNIPRRSAYALDWGGRNAILRTDFDAGRIKWFKLIGRFEVAYDRRGLNPLILPLCHPGLTIFLDQLGKVFFKHGKPKLRAQLASDFFENVKME
jgi:hypothetical protein